MFYYLVWVRSNRYHSKEALTYSSKAKLAIGSLVQVELQKTLVSGLVMAQVAKPKFKTKEVNIIHDLPPLPKVTLQLAQWLKSYYPAPLGIISQQFLPATIPLTIDSPKTSKATSSNLPPLNDEQRKAFLVIDKPGTYLLHGRTGSGKTRLYIELATQTIKKGCSVIVLSPEIGLSSQLFDNFLKAFRPDQLITLHSRQTPKERQQAWARCLTADQPLIVIGPRSAIFSPLKNIGLVVIDEMHDGAYKQEQLPHYQTVRVASALSQLAKATLILGSATPSVSDYFLAITKDRPIVKLSKLARGPSAKSKVSLINLKERDSFSKSAVLSDALIESINLSLSHQEQSLIFLNRRGTSRLILCEHCGWEALCPNCNLPLIYHGDLHQLRCHNCGHLEKNIPTSCPNCGSQDIIYTTVGTKAVVDEVKKLFKAASLKRFDTDNSKADSLGQLYKSVLAGEVDILIGTQQLTKGFDLPKLSTVGILQADSNLFIPDYTSEERTFQLITQVLGRISRGHVDGRAIIQTYRPDSLLLKAAIDQDFQAFYASEIKQRQKYRLPPFYSLLKISCLRATAKSAESAALKLKAQLKNLDNLILEGPAPSFHERQQGKYQWQLIVKSTNRSRLISVISMLPSGFTYDIDPSNLL